MNNIKTTKSRISHFSFAAMMFASASVSTISVANDISHKLRNATEENNTTENYFELGLGAAIGVGPSLTNDDDKWKGLGIIINGSYNWNGLFIEKHGESRDPLLFGYNAYESEAWSFDLVVGPQFFSLNFDDKFKDLDERTGSDMFGGRLTGYLGDMVVQFNLKHDIGGYSKGTSASALLGRNWQVRNWNFHGLLGLSFSDSHITDYYYGVNEAEAARSQFTEYNPGASVNFSAEAGVTYPITQDWVFRSTARFHKVSDVAMNSPLFETTRSTAMSLSATISYVF